MACDPAGVSATPSICVQQNINLTATAGNQQCGTSVSFQYPYGFNLPFQVLHPADEGYGADARRKLVRHWTQIRTALMKPLRPVLPGHQWDRRLPSSRSRLPLLLVMVVGIFDFGNAYNLKQKVTNVGARSGAAWARASRPRTLRIRRPHPFWLFVTGFDALLSSKVTDCGLGTTTAGRRRRRHSLEVDFHDFLRHGRQSGVDRGSRICFHQHGNDRGRQFRSR